MCVKYGTKARGRGLFYRTTDDKNLCTLGCFSLNFRGAVQLYRNRKIDVTL